MAPKRKAGQWRGTGHYYSVVANNFQPDHLIQAQSTLRDSKEYAARYQLENAPTTGRVHLNMFFYQKHWKTYSATREWLTQFCGDADAEITQLSSLLHAQRWYKYSHKLESRCDGFLPVVVGDQTIIPKACQISGAPDDEVDEPTDYTNWKRRVILLFGGNSTGKSFTAAAECKIAYPDERPYLLPKQAPNQAGRWVGPYAGERSVIIDEWDFKDFSVEQLKMLIDRQPQSVATSSGGRSIMWDPELIYICINAKVAEILEFKSHPQWNGRITEYRHMNVKVNAPDYVPAKCNFDASTSDNYSDGSAYFDPCLPKRKKSEVKKPKISIAEQIESISVPHVPDGDLEAFLISSNQNVSTT